jgi:hypothetical protein
MRERASDRPLPYPDTSLGLERQATSGGCSICRAILRILRQGPLPAAPPALFSRDQPSRRPRRASFRTGSSAEEPVSQDPLWYKDAVFYELHVKAFHDSNGDSASLLY